MTADGFDLYRKPARFAEVRLAQPEPAPTARPSFALDESGITRGDYRDNLKTLGPSVHIPVLEADSDGHAVAGLILVGEDALRDFSYQTSFLSRAPSEELEYDCVNDPENPEASLRRLRGFPDPLPATRGYAGSMEYSRSPSLFSVSRLREQVDGWSTLWLHPGWSAGIHCATDSSAHRSTSW